MPWNTFWLLFVQVALAIVLLTPFVSFFLWMTVGSVTARIAGGIKDSINRRYNELDQDER